MRTIYTGFLCLMMAVITLGTASGQGIPPTYDADPNPGPAPSSPASAQDAVWDIQFQINADSISGGVGLAGAECTGLNFFAAEWGYEPNPLIYKFDMGGNLVDSLSTTFAGSSGIRDMAWDGTYLYGGTAGTSIYCFDVNGTLISTITSPVAVRAIAYDETHDAFWVNNWSADLVLVSKTGVALDTIAGPPSIYGMAYDDVSSGGPYLWLFSGTDSNVDTCQVEQWSIATGAATGVTHSVSDDFGPSIAGGLFTQPNIMPGKLTIGGLAQGIEDIFGYELADITAGYCPAAGAVCDEYISNVQIGSAINNSSLCDNYHDYTNLIAPVNVGVPFTVTVSNGNGWSADQCGIWVDWNQNENFYDDDTIAVTGVPGVGPYTATITPPAGASLGQTRIRIRIMYTGTLDPCDTTSYGEVEDYTLMVSNVAQVDAGVSTIVPVGPAAGNHPVQVQIKNFGLDTLTSATIGYSVNGVAGSTYNWTGSLAPLDASDTLTIAASQAFTQGSNTITAWTSMPNGTTDGNTVNDTISWTGYLVGAISTLPYTEGWENGLGNWLQSTTDDFDWSLNSGGTSSLSTGPSAAQEGTYYLYTESSTPRVSGDVASMHTIFDLTSYNTVNISFWYHMYGGSTGTLSVDVHADSMWHNDVWSMTGDQGDMWYEAIVSLDSIAGGHDDVMVRFRGTLADDGTGIVYWGDMAIDNFEMFQPSAADVGIDNIVEPVSGWLTSTNPVTATIRNFGTSPQSNFTVGYQVDTNTVVTETVTGTVPVGGTLDYTFSATADLGTVGSSYDVTVWTALSSDPDPTNDTAMVSVTCTTPGTYCAASGGGDEYISNVTIGTINNTTGEDGYMDYTAMSTDITVGNPLSLTVTNGNPYSVDQCGVWVDWNQNGNFYDDPAVMVSGTPGAGPYMADVAPPANADTGQTRMRIRIRYTGALDPCGTTSWGEVEDYTLNVIPSLANDVGLVSIDMMPIINAGPVVPMATVRNFGSVAQTFDVTMTIGAYSQTETVTNLAPYTQQQISFPSWTAPAGSYMISVHTALAGDQNMANDSLDQPINVASGTAQWKGLYEEFTSSTCAPCAGFNSGTMTPWMAIYEDSVTLVKYQMSWPTSPSFPNGDPYYTAEGGARRQYYGVNAVPDLFWVGRPSIMSTAGMTSQLVSLQSQPTFWDISGTATRVGTDLTVDMNVMPYVNSQLTAHIVVVEEVTTGNVATNGETQFNNVMMKMMPNASGTPLTLVDNITSSITETTNLATTNVEELDDLTVVLFLQDELTQAVVQSAYVDVVVGTADNEEENLAIFPNPTNGMLKIYGAENAEIRIFNTLGAQVYSIGNFQDNVIDLGGFPTGTYIVKVTTEEGTTTRKVVLMD